jgi:hypothetical protein
MRDRYTYFKICNLVKFQFTQFRTFNYSDNFPLILLIRKFENLIRWEAYAFIIRVTFSLVDYVLLYRRVACHFCLPTFSIKCLFSHTRYIQFSTKQDTCVQLHKYCDSLLLPLLFPLEYSLS